VVSRYIDSVSLQPVNDEEDVVKGYEVEEGLRFGNEVRRPGIYFGELGDAKPDPNLMKLADQLVAQKTEPWSEKLMEDPVQTHLLKIIDKKRGSLRKSAPGSKPATVINLFDALRESLKEDGARSARKQ
jgi:DNA end-binding protein Ku